MVLAEGAGEIAPGGAERQHRRAGQEMIERFFLDRVDAEAGRAAVAGQLHPLAVLARAPDEAKAALPGAQMAEARAHAALDPPVPEPGPIADLNAVVAVAGAHRPSAALARRSSTAALILVS